MVNFKIKIEKFTIMFINASLEDARLYAYNVGENMKISYIYMCIRIKKLYNFFFEKE